MAGACGCDCDLWLWPVAVAVACGCGLGLLFSCLSHAPRGKPYTQVNVGKALGSVVSRMPQREKPYTQVYVGKALGTLTFDAAVSWEPVANLEAPRA